MYASISHDPSRLSPGTRVSRVHDGVPRAPLDDPAVVHDTHARRRVGARAPAGVVGLYGVLAYVVAQRTREIGVRMALGATAGVVRRQVVAQGTKVVLIGVIIGVAAARASTRFLDALLYEVTAVDPVVFAAMSLLMISIGAIASYMPARRASSVPPIQALRTD